MDVFLEKLVKKRRDGKDYAILIALVLCGLAITLCLFLFLIYLFTILAEFGQIAGGIGMLIIAAVWYGVYLIYNSRSIEYEYIVINSNLDIDKVMAKKRRKNVFSLDIKDAEIMACVDDEDNNYVFKNLDTGVKVLNLSADNPNMYTYFIDCTAEGKREIVLFQPTSKMVEALWRFNPKAVKKYNI